MRHSGVLMPNAVNPDGTLTHAQDSVALIEAVLAGRTVFGGWLSTDSDGPLYAFEEAGYDFPVIDTQHAPISEEAANRLMETVPTHRLPPGRTGAVK